MKALSLSEDPVVDLTPSQRKEALRKEEFFHDMVLDGVRTGTRIYPPDLPSNNHLFPVFSFLADMDLSEAECLDVGTYDGMTAFALHELGARSIHATCQYNLRRFRLARAILEAESILYYPKAEIEDLEPHFGAHRLDVVVASAMIHHLASPLDAILTFRRLLKHQGFLLLEAAALDTELPALVLNTELASPALGASRVWIPSISAVRGMLNVASFEVVAETWLSGGKRERDEPYERVTFLAKAVAPSEVTGGTAATKEALQERSMLGPLDFDELRQPSESSSVRYRGPTGRTNFNVLERTVPLDLQPPWVDPSADR